VISPAIIRGDLPREALLLHRRVEPLIVGPFGLLKFDADGKVGHLKLLLLLAKA
jgi:hypothetical protein